jgi:hypothetical protein
MRRSVIVFGLLVLFLCMVAQRSSHLTARNTIVKAGGALRYLESHAQKQSFGAQVQNLIGVDFRINVYSISLRGVDTSQVWEQLFEFPEISGLDLSGCPLAADQFTSVGRLKNLVILNVSNTPATDRIVLDLVAQLPRLAGLDITNSFVSDEAVTRLRHTSPRLKVWR